MSEVWEDLPETEPFPHIRVRLSPQQYRERLAENPEEGARFVREAALSGLAEAQVGWGHMLLDGYGVERDEEAAVRWFKLAADQDNIDAFNMLGRCYERGWGVEADPIKAMFWFERAAEKGHDWAQFNLASVMLATYGGQADLRRALSLLVASARAGNAKAMNMLGRWREQGWDGRLKRRSAALWFRWASERGCYRGQFHHARFLLHDGKTTEAISWLRSSLRQAPPDFVRDAAAILLGQDDERIQRIGREALAACEAAGS